METQDFNHFKLVSEGGNFVANCRPRPGCPSSIEATKNCPTTKAKNNWKASTGRCVVIADDDIIFKVDFGILNDLNNLIISEDLRKVFTDKGINLVEGATINIEVDGEMWLLDNKNKVYVIKKDDKYIIIYELKI